MPMTKESKESGLLFATHTFTGMSDNDFTTRPIELSNIDTRRNLTNLNEHFRFALQEMKAV